jgi:uncharacterized membrane protein
MGNVGTSNSLLPTLPTKGNRGCTYGCTLINRFSFYTFLLSMNYAKSKKLKEITMQKSNGNMQITKKKVFFTLGSTTIVLVALIATFAFGAFGHHTASHAASIAPPDGVSVCDNASLSITAFQDSTNPNNVIVHISITNGLIDNPLPNLFPTGQWELSSSASSSVRTGSWTPTVQSASTGYSDLSANINIAPYGNAIGSFSALISGLQYQANDANNVLQPNICTSGTLVANSVPIGSVGG